MSSTIRHFWDGHAQVGYQVTIPIPVSDHDANGDPVDRDLSGDMLAVVVTDSADADVTATVAYDATIGKTHLANVTITSANADEAGRHTIDLYIGANPEPVTPGWAFTMEPA